MVQLLTLTHLHAYSIQLTELIAAWPVTLVQMHIYVD